MTIFLNNASSMSKYKGLHNSKSLAIMELFKDNYVSINHYKGGNMNMRPADWSSFYKQLDSLFKGNKRLLVYDSRWHRYLKEGKLNAEAYYPDKAKLNFRSLRMFWASNMAMIHAKRSGLELIQILDDPLGFRFADTVLWFYDYKGMHAFPYAEYGYYFKERCACEKTKEFAFFAKDWITKGKRFDGIELPMGSYISKCNKDFVAYALCNEVIKSAKYTLIVPSVDRNAMSMMRFWEALAYGTIPLVHKSCKWQDAFSAYPKLQKFIPELIVGDSVKFPKVKFSDIPIDNKLNNIKYYEEAVNAYSL